MISNQENHVFSVELTDKGNLKTLELSDSSDKKTVIEGFLGNLETIDFVENAMLEIHGSNGTFRIDIDPQVISQIQNALKKVEKR
jgi:hypothetical protein